MLPTTSCERSTALTHEKIAGQLCYIARNIKNKALQAALAQTVLEPIANRLSQKFADSIGTSEWGSTLLRSVRPVIDSLTEQAAAIEKEFVDYLLSQKKPEIQALLETRCLVKLTCSGSTPLVASITFYRSSYGSKFDKTSAAFFKLAKDERGNFSVVMDSYSYKDHMRRSTP